MSVDWVDGRVNRSIGMPSAGAAGVLDVGIWACSPKGLVLLWSCNAACSIEQTSQHESTGRMASPPAATAGAGEGSAAAAAHDGAAAPSTSTEGSRASGGGSTSPARAQQQVGGVGGGSGSGGGGGAAAHRSPLGGNGMAKFVVFMLLVGNLLMLSNVFQVRVRCGGGSKVVEQ